MSSDVVCCSSDENDGEEGCGGFLISGRDSPPLLEPCPQVFDQMLVSVSLSGTGDFWISLLWRDDRTRSPVPEIFTEFVRSIPTVIDDIGRWVRQIVEQGISGWQSMCLAG